MYEKLEAYVAGMRATVRNLYSDVTFSTTTPYLLGPSQLPHRHHQKKGENKTKKQQQKNCLGLILNILPHFGYSAGFS